MAQIPIEEAIRLGLVPQERLDELIAQGLLTSPFARSGGGVSAFWRMPSITRGGLYTPRFGLGPLSQGLALSPAAPAISGGGVPVGRRNQSTNKGAPDLQTLIGAGDVNEIARRVASGQVDPNQLPPAIRQQVLQILQPPRREDQDGGAAADSQKALGIAKQVLGLAKNLLPKGSPAQQIIEQQEAQALGQESGPSTGGETAQGATAPVSESGGSRLPSIPGAPSQTAPTGQIDAAKLEALGFTPEQISQIIGAIPADAAGPVGMGNISFGGENRFEPIPLVGDQGASMIMTKNASGIWEASPELQRAIASGGLEISPADVRSLAEQGFTADQIINEFGVRDTSSADFEGMGGGEQGAGAGAAGALIGGGLGALTIGQAIADPNLNKAQKALRATSGAAQIGMGVAPLVGAAGAVPYLGAAAGLANVGVTAAGPGPSDQKAASAAIDAAAAAVSTGLAMTGYGAVLIPFVMPIASLVKQNIMKAFGEPHKVREAKETSVAGGKANQLINQIQGTKSEGELYELLRAWSSPLVGGSSMNNDPRLGGLDPMPVNVMAKGAGGPDWDYLGLYGAGTLNPNAPTPQQFFDRILQNPDDLQVQIQQGIKPELMAPMNQAIRNSLREQIAELRVREYVRPNLLNFSRMAGVIVTEDDVVDALRKTGGVMDTPEFPAILRQSERLGAEKRATQQAMADQPFLPAAEYGSTDNLREKGAQKAYLESLAQVGEVFPEDTQYAYQKSLAQAGFDPSGTYVGETSQQYMPEQRYPAVQAGYTFKPGVGWVDSQGNVGLATGALPAPEPFLEAAGVPQPPSTATPPSAPAVDANGAPLPTTGQSAVPPTSPLAPDEPLQPLGIMHQGGVIPQTGVYQLAQGETVLPSPHQIQDDPEALRRYMPNMDRGGVVPASGLYKMQAGETVVPAPRTLDTDDPRSPFDYGDPSGIAGHGEMSIWVEDGRAIRSTVRPQPALKNPGMLWVQDEANQWQLVDPLDYPTIEEYENREKDYGQEAYYLDPKRGVPFAESKNPDPSKTWRLVFEPNDLHEAWKNRRKDGAPLLVPRSVLNRRDWADVVEKARQSQYVGVHPAVLLARETPPERQSVLGGDYSVEIDLDAPSEVHKFWEERMRPGPVPVPEKTPPVHKMPGSRPMSDEEMNLFRKNYPPEVS